ncbi:hypothetical protein SPLA10_PHROGS00070 [Salmonella phage SPLA10]|nr:hypothetical protein SPLA10_PHROGS00070 [Salmonella phage SPLA10]
MYRRDEKLGVKKKHIPRYRFAISVLATFFVLYVCVTVFFGIKTLNKEVNAAEAPVVTTSPVDDHKDLSRAMSYLIHKKNLSEFLNEAALYELDTICKDNPKDCADSTRRTMMQLKDFLDAAQKEKALMEDAYLKEKAAEEPVKK